MIRRAKLMSWPTLFAALMVALHMSIKTTYAAEYIDFLDDLYSAQNTSNPHGFLFNIQLDALTVTGETCLSGSYRGRAGNVNESFVYVNGDDIPDDAVTFAGIFDLENDLELAVFRGKCIGLSILAP